ncbi:MAG: hypothetical protein FXF54_09595 [Kosmotoga sp.]|nr:MAG: hypothetical protein FXF54_09595 [Kosmotoga sp.]
MKKLLLVFSVAALLLVLAGCPSWFPPTFPSDGQKALDDHPIQDVLDTRDATENDIGATIAGVITYIYDNYLVVQNGNAGIKIFKYGAFAGTTLKRGDVVTAVGTVTYYYNNYELEIDEVSDVEKVDEGFEVDIQDFPTDTEINESVGKQYNYELVKLTNVVVEEAADTYHNVDVQNGSETVTIYSFDSDVRDWLDNLSVGDTIEEIVGFIENTYGWKIVIRDSEDYTDN